MNVFLEKIRFEKIVWSYDRVRLKNNVYVYRLVPATSTTLHRDRRHQQGCSVQ